MYKHKTFQIASVCVLVSGYVNTWLSNIMHGFLPGCGLSAWLPNKRMRVCVWGLSHVVLQKMSQNVKASSARHKAIKLHSHSCSNFYITLHYVEYSEVICFTHWVQSLKSVKTDMILGNFPWPGEASGLQIFTTQKTSYKCVSSSIGSTSNTESTINIRV